MSGGMKSPTFSTTDLNQLQAQIKTWRQRQVGRPHLPETFWEAAAAHARTEGVSRVSRTLRLDYYRLQRRLLGGPNETLDSVPPAGFMELKLAPPLSPSVAGGLVELVAGPDRRLLIHTGSDPAAWVALAEAFWKAHP